MDGKLRPTYSEFRTYSPIRDCLVSRISMADSRGLEFWMEVVGEGKSYRHDKAKAIDQIMEAIERGREPGEVVPG